MSARVQLLVSGLLLTAAYFFTARLGFTVAFVAQQVTTVWAPTGIAQAALLLWGLELWPAVWVGAFVANLGTDLPWWAAACIATGNTLEAVGAAWLLVRVVPIDPALRRLRDALAFVVAAGAISTAISATIGVATLCLAGAQPWGRFGELWFAWWLGDALGALVVAPAISTFVRRTGERTVRGWIEASALVLATIVVTYIVFASVLGNNIGHHPLEFAIFPFLITAAVRFGQPATAFVVLSAAIVTIVNTVSGRGPFASANVHESLVMLQVFTGTLAGTGLVLAAAITERETIERRRAAAAAVGDALANASTLEAAMSQIVEGVCRTLGWPLGALWIVDTEASRIRCLTMWGEPALLRSSFAAATTEAAFQRGVGLPGRVWAHQHAAWIENVVEDKNFPRASLARAAGLHGAFAFPIALGTEVLGVIEFYQRPIVTPDADLLQTMSAVGHQIGQFIARKRVELAVIDGERRTRAIVETALDAIIGMDKDGLITEFNPAAERMFGHPRERAMGTDLADLIIPSHLRDKHRAGLRRYLATSEGPFINRRVETTARHADGVEFPVEIAITRVGTDNPPRFTGFVRDLTARVRAERERNDLLSRELAARREAEAANRAKDEFLATLSHELRTPLNAIVGWTRMLLEGTLDNRSRKHALEVVDRNAHLQVQLVSDLLDVSRIITGGLRLEMQPVDLGAVIGAALDAVRPAADAKRITLRPILEADARLTQGDPQRLQQIVWNLLANAVKFTPQGGTIEVELANAGEQAISIRIRDSGIGIDSAFVPHVFERFRQADSSFSRQHGGLGLGLAIVRHLVELHGGTVRADSDGPGAGSTFTVDLPRSSTSRSVPADPTYPASTAAALIGLEILIVDDDRDARDLLATIVKTAGGSARTAASTTEALVFLSERTPDVLLADIGLPGEDGYALVRELRRREAGKLRLPVAAITAYASPADREQVLAGGFDRHVAKPIEPAVIVETILALTQR